MNILIIEDDDEIRTTLLEHLRSSGDVDDAENGMEGLRLTVEKSYDLILLDLHLPDMHGREVCKEIRKKNSSTPIIILTGENSPQEVISLLDSGADDYVTKPFRFTELDARIRACMRRSKPYGSKIFQLGSLHLNCEDRSVFIYGLAIRLRRKEFDLLHYLLSNQNRVVSRTMIYDYLWDDTSVPFSNIVDVHIKYLRDHIEKPFDQKIIHTVHGIGYIIRNNL